MPLCRRKAATKPRRLLVPLLTHLPPRNHGVSLRVEAAPLAPARLLPGLFLAAAQLLRRAVSRTRPEIASRRRSASKTRLLGTLRGHPHATKIEHARPGALNQANAGRGVPPGRGSRSSARGGQPIGDHTMTDRVLVALALALLALIIAAVILYVAGVVPIFV